MDRRSNLGSAGKGSGYPTFKNWENHRSGIKSQLLKNRQQILQASHAAIRGNRLCLLNELQGLHVELNQHGVSSVMLQQIYEQLLPYGADDVKVDRCATRATVLAELLLQTYEKWNPDKEAFHIMENSGQFTLRKYIYYRRNNQQRYNVIEIKFLEQIKESQPDVYRYFIWLVSQFEKMGLGSYKNDYDRCGDQIDMLLNEFDGDDEEYKELNSVHVKYDKNNTPMKIWQDIIEARAQMFPPFPAKLIQTPLLYEVAIAATRVIDSIDTIGPYVHVFTEDEDSQPIPIEWWLKIVWDINDKLSEVAERDANMYESEYGAEELYYTETVDSSDFMGRNYIKKLFDMIHLWNTNIQDHELSIKPKAKKKLRAAKHLVDLSLQYAG